MFVRATSLDSLSLQIEALACEIENKACLKIDTSIICSYPSVNYFYQQRAFKPAWVKQSNIDILRKALNRVEEHGLNASEYPIHTINYLLENADEFGEHSLAKEFLLTDVFLKYASDLLYGKLKPDDYDANWHAIDKGIEPFMLLEEGVNTSLNIVLPHLVPQDKRYAKLQQELALFQALDTNAKNWDNLVLTKPLQIGDSAQIVSRIKDRLFYLGYFKLENYSLETKHLFNEHLHYLMLEYQYNHGITPTGVIDKETLASLNRKPKNIINDIKVNLERWRWLPTKLEPYRIEVNIPAYILEFYKNDSMSFDMRVVVGKKDRSTPVFYSEMDKLVFNPTWTIPPGILKKDIIPAVKKYGNAYLSRKNMAVYTLSGKKVDPALVNWNSSDPYIYKIRQEPGLTNALGTIKFLFDNPYYIYLHDTPSKTYFNYTNRAYSSGCVRVRDPQFLADKILNNYNGWNTEAIDSVINSRKTTTVTLQNGPMVYLNYFTTWVDENGKLQTRKDVYGRNQKILEGLIKN